MRAQVESALAGRVPRPFHSGDSQEVEKVSTGNAEIDALTGGLPRGGITEICGPSCSGRTSLLMSILTAHTAEGGACALIDARDSFDPASAVAAGVELGRLLWVRCRNIDQALQSADLILHAGGFGLVVLDLGDIPPETVRYVSLNVWFRFRRAVEHSPVIFLVLDQEPYITTCASLVLRMEMEAAEWSRSTVLYPDLTRVPHACLLAGSSLRSQVVRSRSQAMAQQKYFGSPEVSLKTLRHGRARHAAELGGS